MAIQRLLLVLGVLGASIPAWSQARLDDRLRPSDPVYCEGNDDLEIRGRVIETDGNGLEVRGNCDVEIFGSRIVAGGIGILVQGNGGVEIYNCDIEGAAGGVVLDGNASASYRNSTIRGGVHVNSVLADVSDDGGNVVDDRVSRAPRSSGSTVNVGDIEITEDGVRVGRSGQPDVKITDQGIEIGGRQEVAVREDGSVLIDSGGSRVIVDGDYVRLEPGDSSVVISGDWRDRGSTVYSSSDTGRILIELGATTDGGDVQLDLAGDVLFDFDSTAIRPGAAEQLRKVAHVIRERAAGEVYLIGHTDSLGDRAYNQKLSEARAVSVMRWLNENESIPISLLRGRGLGADKPIAHNTKPDGSDDPEGRAKNRRVEIRFASR